MNAYQQYTINEMNLQIRKYVKDSSDAENRENYIDRWKIEFQQKLSRNTRSKNA